LNRTAISLRKDHLTLYFGNSKHRLIKVLFITTTRRGYIIREYSGVREPCPINYIIVDTTGAK
jgi:hypothetical protein